MRIALCCSLVLAFAGLVSIAPAAGQLATIARPRTAMVFPELTPRLSLRPTSEAHRLVTPGLGSTTTAKTGSTEAGTSPESSLVGVWHLNERSGRIVHDGSGHGHDGSIRGFVTVGVPGTFRTAFYFEPQSNVVIRDAPDLRPGTADITVSYWLKTSARPSKPQDFDIFDKGDQFSRGGQIKLEVQANGQASCSFRGALGGKQLQAGPNVANGRWHHVICQRIGDRIVQTVDGRSYFVTKRTGAIRVAAPVVLGSHHHKGDWYHGVLDEVRYYVDRD